MTAIAPQPLTKESFLKFGTYIGRDDMNCQTFGSMTVNFTKEAPIHNRLKAGITQVKGGSFTSKYMERHFLGEEVILCNDSPMILTVADSNPNGKPQSADVQGFYMEQGDIVILGKGIWHDANHGVTQDTEYYFLIEDYQNSTLEMKQRETEWHEIECMPVRVEIV